MLYTLESGRNIRIPDAQLKIYMDKLGLTKDEAVQMYLEDEGFEENAEQAALDEKAKKNRVTATVHKARTTKEGEKKPRERKPDEQKEALIAGIAEALQHIATLEVTNVTITKKSKLEEFDMEGAHYKLDLIRQRPPKAK